MRNSHSLNQNIIREGRGVVGCTTRTMIMQHWDQIHAGDKLSGGVYMQYNLGFKVWSTEKDIRHRGGIAIDWREVEVWKFEGATKFGQKMASFTIMSRRRRWYVVVAYVPPNNQP